MHILGFLVFPWPFVITGSSLSKSPLWRGRGFRAPPPLTTGLSMPNSSSKEASGAGSSWSGKLGVETDCLPPVTFVLAV